MIKKVELNDLDYSLLQTLVRDRLKTIPYGKQISLDERHYQHDLEILYDKLEFLEEKSKEERQ